MAEQGQPSKEAQGQAVEQLRQMPDDALLTELLTQVAQYDDAVLTGIALHVRDRFEALLYALNRVGTAQQQPSAQSTNQESKLKVEPPKVFTGRGKELANFLFTLKAYLEVKGVTSDTKRVQYAATRLDGDALVWWRSVDATG